MAFGNPVWDEIFSQRTWGQYPSEEAVRFVKRALAWGVPGKSALDIGAGQGACSWMLQKEGFQVTAFDGAPAGLAHIENTVRTHGSTESPETILGNIVEPERFLKERRFDLLLDHYSLYANFRAEIWEAFRQYHRLLQPSGYLLSCCFGKRTSSFERGRKVGEDCFEDIQEGLPLAGRGRATFFDKLGFEALLENAGFDIVYTEVILQEDARGALEKLVVCARKPSKSKK